MDKDGNIQLTEINGKPVFTSIGTSPLEAWSQALIKLGLVDEFIVECVDKRCTLLELLPVASEVGMIAL